MGELLTDLTLKNARALPDIRPSIDTLSEGTSPHTHRPRWASEENMSLSSLCAAAGAPERAAAAAEARRVLLVTWGCWPPTLQRAPLAYGAF